LRIAETILVEVKQVQAQPVLHFAFPQIMQARLPMTVLAQVLHHVRGQKNMPGIAAIQHSLRNIDSRTGYVRFLVNIDNSANRTAMNSHPQLDARMILQCSANLERTSGRFFRTVEENQRHPIARWHSDEFAGCFRRSKTFGVSHDLIQFLEKFNLLIDQQLRVAHHID
jgi:hypothetical protein